MTPSSSSPILLLLLLKRSERVCCTHVGWIGVSLCTKHTPMGISSFTFLSQTQSLGQHRCRCRTLSTRARLQICCAGGNYVARIWVICLVGCARGKCTSRDWIHSMLDRIRWAKVTKITPKIVSQFRACDLLRHCGTARIKSRSGETYKKHIKVAPETWLGYRKAMMMI